MLTQLTADIGCYNGFSLEDCAARFVACVRDAQQAHGVAQALRRLEVVSRCPVTLWRIWCVVMSAAQTPYAVSHETIAADVGP